MKNFLFTALISITLMSCTAKRPEIFTQGQGTDLDAIASWNERIIPINTGKVIGTASSTHAQDSRTVSPEVKVMNTIDDLVKIEVLDPNLVALVGDPPFRGKPNTKGVYAIKVKLTDKYLKFYKVALPENLPYEEQAYKEETLADGRITIPMLGYKISGYYHVEPVKTSDDQNSHRLTEIADKDYSKSTHVKIDWSSRELFEAVMTSDLIPSELFFSKVHDNAKDKDEFKPYEWYYAETVIDKSLNDSSTIVGETSIRDEQSALVPASKVMFIPRENELRIVNIARDERLTRDQIQNSADLNSEAALIIPVKWVEHRIKADGKNSSLKGETVVERKWDQRHAFEMNLPEIRSAGINGGATRLLDIEVDQNYFSFTVLNMVGNKGRKIHYSFLRADEGRAPYKPRQSFKADRKLFGFFTSKKPFIPNFDYYTEENFEKRIFMSRMNPDAKEIVFHLSAGSPAWLEDIAERTVQAWDHTFSEALKGSGREIKIRFDKKRVQLGDLRYNVIHLVETLSEDGLLGFGPSVADPETGEIISATTNVYVNSTQAIAANTVRQYIIDRLEKRLGNDVSGEPILSEGDAGVPVELEPAAARLVKIASLPSDKNTMAGKVGKYTLADAAKDLKTSSKNGACYFAEEAMMSSNDRDIKNHCPEVESLVKGYLASSLDVTSRSFSKANWEKVWSESSDAIKSCSKSLARGKLLSTLIHEVGHNFGLRHNFYGSYDKANFKKSKTIFSEEITAHSSSIMEYTDWDEDRLTETGPYDVAAIRFGYGEQVEMNNGEILKIDPMKSVDPKGLKSYLFCTDEETLLNALCKRHDVGTSPMEMVQFYIKNYKRSEALRKLRRAKPLNSDPSGIAESNLGNTFLPMREIYDQWRYQLGEYVRKSARYLGGYDVDSYKKMLEGMKADPQYGPVYEQYHDAAEMVYFFFKEVALGSNEYCMIQDGPEQRAIELERLRDLISDATRGSVMIRSCQDAVEKEDTVKVLAKVLDVKTPKVIQQVGYPINSYRFENVSNYDEYVGVDTLGYEHERFDVVGNKMTRSYAGLLINLRMDNLRNLLSQFSPNMTDEPTYYRDFKYTMFARMLDGVDLSEFKLAEPQPLFSQESSLLNSMASMFQEGLSTPGERLNIMDSVATANKLSPLSVYRMTQSEDPKEFVTTLSVNGRKMFGAIGEENELAVAFIETYKKVNNKLSLTPTAMFSQIAEPYHSETPKVTLNSVLTTASILSRLKSTFPDYRECIVTKSPFLTNFSKVFDQFVADYQAAKDEKAFLETPLEEYEKTNLKGVSMDYSLDAMKKLTSVLTSCYQDQKAGYELRKVKNYRKDYEAQKGLLIDVMNMYAE